MNDQGQPRHGWTVVLRRRPVRIIQGWPEGGYTDEYEIICCYCGDDPDLDYLEVSSQLQRIRGPYPITAGIAAYVKHAGRHPRSQGCSSQAARVRDVKGCSPAAGSPGSGFERWGWAGEHPSSPAETSRRDRTLVERE
jgi:hypothetical protein